MISKYLLTNLVLQTIDECFQPCLMRQPCLVRQMIPESRQSSFSMVQLAASDSAQQLTENAEIAGLPDVLWNYLVHTRKRNAINLEL